MSRDMWLKQLRTAGADTRSIEDVLAENVPVDGLQHAGCALLRTEPSDVLAAIARSLVEALGDRDWTGDTELTAELEHYAHRTAADLIGLPVPLDELGEALDQSAGSESFIDVTNGALPRHPWCEGMSTNRRRVAAVASLPVNEGGGPRSPQLRFGSRRRGSRRSAAGAS